MKCPLSFSLKSQIADVILNQSDICTREPPNEWTHHIAEISTGLNKGGESELNVVHTACSHESHRMFRKEAWASTESVLLLINNKVIKEVEVFWPAFLCTTHIRFIIRVVISIISAVHGSVSDNSGLAWFTQHSSVLTANLLTMAGARWIYHLVARNNWIYMVSCENASTHSNTKHKMLSWSIWCLWSFTGMSTLELWTSRARYWTWRRQFRFETTR